MVYHSLYITFHHSIFKRNGTWKTAFCCISIRASNWLTGGRIWDWEMMLFGRLFCRLAVVISAQVTWKPVIRWWGATRDTRHTKLPVMFPSLMENEAVRFSGLARTFGSTGAVLEKGGPNQCVDSKGTLYSQMIWLIPLSCLHPY